MYGSPLPNRDADDVGTATWDLSSWKNQRKWSGFVASFGSTPAPDGVKATVVVDALHAVGSFWSVSVVPTRPAGVAVKLLMDPVYFGLASGLLLMLSV